MSKSVSDQKVEDVLSSVRRLVSSELPRKARPSVPEGPGALVLTEAHRVESRRKPQKKHSLEDRIAELEAAIGNQDNEFEPDGSEDQAQHQPDRIVYTRPPVTRGEGAERSDPTRLSKIALIETGPANDDLGGRGETKADAAPEFRREAPMAEDVPTEPRRSAEVRAFTDPDDVVRNIEARIASGRPISDPLPLGEPVVVPDKGATDSKSQDSDDFDDALTRAVAASVASSIAEPEAEGREADQQDEADSDRVADVLAADEFDYRVFNADTLDPQVTAAELLADPEDKLETATDDIAEAEVIEEKAAEQPAPSARQEPATSETATGAAVAALAALPEEEAMRLLVGRMIRDELQGELGERITRNVRKLVRREIKRALTSKDLI